MTRSMALMAVSVLFLLGIAAGALGMHQLHGGGPLKGLHAHGSHLHAADSDFMQELDELLQLSPEQAAELQEILRQSHHEARRMHQEMLPRVQAHMDETKDRVLKLLTPEQREKFDDLHILHRNSAERLFLGHGRHERHEGGKPGN